MIGTHKHERYTIHGDPEGWHVIRFHHPSGAPTCQRPQIRHSTLSHGDITEDQASEFVKMIGLGDEF